MKKIPQFLRPLLVEYATDRKMPKSTIKGYAEGTADDLPLPQLVANVSEQYEAKLTAAAAEYDALIAQLNQELSEKATALASLNLENINLKSALGDVQEMTKKAFFGACLKVNKYVASVLEK